MRLSEVEDIDDYDPSNLHNHGHQLLEDSIVVFTNHGGVNRKSAVVEYSLEEEDGGWSGSKIFSYDSGLVSDYWGDVQRLPEGNTMVTYSTGREIQEVNEDDDGNVNLLMSIQFDGNEHDSLGYSTWRPTLYGPPPN